MNDTEYTNEDIDCLVEKISKQQGELEALWEHISAFEKYLNSQVSNKLDRFNIEIR